MAFGFDEEGNLHIDDVNTRDKSFIEYFKGYGIDLEHKGKRNGVWSAQTIQNVLDFGATKVMNPSMAFDQSQANMYAKAIVMDEYRTWKDSIVRAAVNEGQDVPTTQDLYNRISFQLQEVSNNIKKKIAKQKGGGSRHMKHSSRVSEMEQRVSDWEQFVKDFQNGDLQTLMQATANPKLELTGAGIPTNPAARIQSTLMGVYGRKQSKLSEQFVSPGTKIVDAINKATVSGADLAPVVFPDGGGIWRHLNAAKHGYGAREFQTQRVLEQFQALEAHMNNNGSFVAMDIENLGDRETGKLFHITEIAAHGFEHNGTNYATHTGIQFEALLRPQDDVHTQLSLLIDQISADPSYFHSLDETEQRSLVDLMRYSTFQGNVTASTAAQFDASGKISRVLTHNDILDRNQLFSGKNRNDNVLVRYMSEYALHMKSGLSNLSNVGTDSETAMTAYNSFVSGNQDKFWLTHNGEVHDLPGLRRFADTIGVSLEDLQNHVDFYKVLEATYADPVQMAQVFTGETKEMSDAFLQSIFQRNGRTPVYQEGPRTLVSLRRFLGLDVTGAHAAAMDVGEQGLGGIFLKTWDKIASTIRGSKMEAEEGYKRKGMSLAYDNSYLEKGQLLFSESGLQDGKGVMNSFMAEKMEDGSYRVLGEDFNRTVFHSRTFYEVGDLRQFEHPETGQNMFALELMDNERGSSTFVVGQDRHEIASLIQRQMMTWNGAREEGVIEAMMGLSLQDRARRRLSDMYSTEQKLTSGWQMLDRTMSNIGIARNLMEQTGDDFATVWENNRDAFNFMSLWDADAKSVVHNPYEEEAFPYLFDRLNSEYNIIKPAMDKIEESYKIDDSMGDTAKKTVLRQRSEAMQEYNILVDNAIGEHREIRKLAEHENKFLTIGNGRKGEAPNIRINLQSADTALKDIRKFMYEDNNSLQDRELPVAQINRRAEERMLTLVRRIQESGFFATYDTDDQNRIVGFAKDEEGRAMDGLEEVKRFSTEYHRSGLSAYEMSARLANDLYHSSQIVQATTDQESLKVREAAQLVHEEQTEERVKEAIAKQRILESNSLSVESLLSSTDPKMEALRKLDGRDMITGLKHTNVNTIETIMNTLNNHDLLQRGGLATSISISDDMSQAIVHVFENDKLESVTAGLREGIEPTKAVRISIPLTTAEGTMVHGGLTVNARSELIKDGVNTIKISSGERLARDIRSRITPMLSSIYNHGDWNRAQGIMDKVITEYMTSLSGMARDMDYGDMNIYHGAVSDIVKQANVDPSTALIHDLYDNGSKDGILKIGDGTPNGSHFKSSAWQQDANGTIILDHNNNPRLKPYVKMDDLTALGQDVARRRSTEWLTKVTDEQGNQIFNLYVSGVRDSKFAGNAMLSYLDARKLEPFSEYSLHTRDNIIQSQGAIKLTDEQIENLKALNESGKVKVKFDNIVSSETAYKLEQQGRYNRTAVHTPVVYMSNEELAKRLDLMAGTEAGLKMLTDRGWVDSVNADGNVVFNELKPTLHEQQAMVHGDLISSFRIQNERYLDAGDAFFPDESIRQHFDYDEVSRTWSLQEGKEVKIDSGARIGTIMRSGKEMELYNNLPTEGTIFEQTGRGIGLKYEQEIHKAFFDIEKGTFGGGQNRYDSEFLEALTGMKGVGAVINADFGKHKDFGHLIRGHINRGLDRAEELGKKGKAITDKYADDLQIRYDEEAGRYFSNVAYQDVDGKVMPAKTLQEMGNKIDEFLKALDIDQHITVEDDTYGLKGRSAITTLQAMYGARTETYAKTVGFERNRIGFDGEGISGVQYGHRELDVLKNMGADEVYNEVLNTMVADATETGRLQEIQGMEASLASLVMNPEEIHPDDWNKRVIEIDQLAPAPTYDTNVATARNTVLDDQYIRSVMRGNGLTEKEANAASGFYLKLPNRTEDGLTLQVADSAQEYVYVPLTKQQGRGNDVWKTDIQRMNAELVERARAYQNAPTTGGKAGEALNELKKTFANFGAELTKQISSSKGMAFQSALKTPMMNSSSGILKIQSPDTIDLTADKYSGASVTISKQDALKMGFSQQEAEAIMRGETEHYVTNLRYPTFHMDALQVARLNISNDVKAGEHHIDAITAMNLRGDSDGDYNHMVSWLVGNDETSLKRRKALQDELSRIHKSQSAEDLARMRRWNTAYDNLIARTQAPEGEIPVNKMSPAEVYKQIAKESEKMPGMIHDGTNDIAVKWNMQDLFKGQTEKFIINDAQEVVAKSGKAIVGMASDYNFRINKIADNYLGTMRQVEQGLLSEGDARKREAIHYFGSMLEQKIISAKHTNSDTIDLTIRQESLRMLDLLQRGNWQGVRDLYEQTSGEEGMFKGFHIPQAMDALESLAELDYNASRQLRVGLSSGMRIQDFVYEEKTSRMTKESVQRVLNAVSGTDLENKSFSTTAMNVLGALMEKDNLTNDNIREFLKNSTVQEESIVSRMMKTTESSIHKMAEAASSPDYHIPRSSLAAKLGEATEWMSKRLEGRGGIVAGIGAAAGLGALALFHATGADDLSSNDLGHENEEIQDAHTPPSPPMPQQGGTAYLEQNGQGYNGLNIRVSGKAAGEVSHEQLGSLAGQALHGSGIQANINVRAQDDRSSVDQTWLQQKFAELLTGGTVMK